MKFEIIKKDNKYFFKSPDCFIDPNHEAMIYKANTDKPYIKYAGYTATLEPEHIAVLRRLGA